MGASASTIVDTTENNIVNQSYQGCGTGQTYNVNETDISNLNYSQPSWCPADSTGLQIGQTAIVDANCVLGNMQNNTANVAAKLSATSQAGLGFSASTDVATTRNNLQNYTEQQCASESSTNVVDFHNANIYSCDFNVMQNATDKTNCQISATQQQAAQVAQNFAAQSKGGSFFGDIFGGGIGSIITIAIVVVIVLIIGGVAISLLGRSKKELGVDEPASRPETGLPPGATTLGGALNNSQSIVQALLNNTSLVILVILVLVLILIVLFTPSTQNKPYLTEQDIDSFSRKVNEAQQLAGLAPSPPIETSDNDLPPQRPEYVAAKLSLNEYFKSPLDN